MSPTIGRRWRSSTKCSCGDPDSVCFGGLTAFDLAETSGERQLGGSSAITPNGRAISAKGSSYLKRRSPSSLEAFPPTRASVNEQGPNPKHPTSSAQPRSRRPDLRLPAQRCREPSRAPARTVRGNRLRHPCLHRNVPHQDRMHRIVFSIAFFRQKLPVRLVSASTKSSRKFYMQVQR
jgi:hypothetical protein